MKKKWKIFDNQKIIISFNSIMFLIYTGDFEKFEQISYEGNLNSALYFGEYLVDFGLFCDTFEFFDLLKIFVDKLRLSFYCKKIF